MKYMEARPKIFPQTDIVFVLERVRKYALKHQDLNQFMKDLITTLDPTKQGSIGFVELV